MLYPDHNYLGPGNPLDNGPPVDNADKIAQKHDYDYNNAQSLLDVHLSDAEAIGKFGLDFIKNPNLPSAAGAIGLAGKKWLEYSTGGATTYPFRFNPIVKGVNSVQKLFTGKDLDVMSEPKKRRLDEKNIADSTSNAVSDSVSSAMEVNPQPGTSLPGGTGADISATIIKNPHIKTVKFRFNKTFQCYTGGFQFTQVSPSTFLPANDKLPWDEVFNSWSKWHLTPLAALDPGAIWMYCTPSEFNNLPHFAYATSCGIKVTPLGYRLPFQTNESQAGYANSQTLVQCCSAVGLNTIFNIAITNYEIPTSTDPTKIANSLAKEPPYEYLMYGSGSHVGACVGVPKHFNMYTAIMLERGGTSTSNPITESPNLIDHMCIQNVNDTKGIPVINYTHEFKNGLLKFPTSASQRNVLNRNSTVAQSTLQEGFTNTLPNYFRSGANQDSGGNGWLDTTYNVNFNPSYTDYAVPGDSTDNFYNFTIEKSYWLQRQIGQQQTPDYSPYVHFGCMPVPSNFALATTETYAASVIQWEVQTCLEVEVNLNSITAYYPVPYLKSWDPVYNNMTMSKKQGRCILIANRRLRVDQTAQPTTAESGLRTRVRPGPKTTDPGLLGTIVGNFTRM